MIAAIAAQGFGRKLIDRDLVANHDRFADVLGFVDAGKKRRGAFVTAIDTMVHAGNDRKVVTVSH